MHGFNRADIQPAHGVKHNHQLGFGGNFAPQQQLLDIAAAHHFNRLVNAALLDVELLNGVLGGTNRRLPFNAPAFGKTPVVFL